jgi:hypothetical protein
MRFSDTYLRMRKRWPFAVAAVGLAGLVTWTSWPNPCPIELKVVSVQPVQIIDEAGQMLCLMTLRVHNPNSVGLRFENLPMIFEQKITNQWVQAHSHWPLGGLSPGWTEEALFLVALGVNACRFRLKYCYSPRRLPFGIGDYWDTVHPQTLWNARVQSTTKRLSPMLFNWLWPKPTSARPLFWEPRWRVGWTPVCSVNSLSAASGQTTESDNHD